MSEHRATDTLATMALGHGLLSIAVGAGLVYSWLDGRVSTSVSYEMLRHTPYWPAGIGVCYVALGCVQLASRVGVDRLLLSAWGFAFMAALSATYGTLFAIGTSEASKGIVGPQVPYYGLALLHSIHATYAARAWRDGRRAAGT